VPTPDPPPEPPQITLDPDQRDWQWKRDRLIEMGVPFEDAELLADVRDVLARMRKLLERGCPPETAARIIL
jgi:hypothetical protein